MEEVRRPYFGFLSKEEGRGRSDSGGEVLNKKRTTMRRGAAGGQLLERWKRHCLPDRGCSGDRDELRGPGNPSY